MKCLINSSLNAQINTGISDRRSASIPVEIDRRRADRRQSSAAVECDRRRVNFAADNDKRNSDRRQIYMPVGIDGRQADRRVVSFTNDKSKSSTQNKGDLFFEACEALPPIRRIKSLPDQIQKGNGATALGMASLALINLPEDCRDVASAFRQLNGGEPSYDYKNYQHNFSFFKGTAIEEWLHKHVDNGSKWAKWFYENDITLAKTFLGKKILGLIKSEENGVIETKIKNFYGNSIPAYSFSGNPFAKLTARALQRTTLLGLCVIGLLEIPKILKSKKKIKQTAKSAINVASITAGIGYGGAIGAKYGGSTGSLIGMGAGAILGNKLSQKAQKLV